MKIGICMTLFLLGSAQAGWGQTEERFAAPGGEEKAADAPENSYTVLGATPREEALVREQISVMHPEVLPLRVLFVPHWKYTGATKAFRLHVPTGFTSAMFTHLASRSVFIDADRYVSEDSLGYWLGCSRIPKAPEGGGEAKRTLAFLLAICSGPHNSGRDAQRSRRRRCPRRN